MSMSTYLAASSILFKDLISIYPIRRNEEPANRFTAWRDRGRPSPPRTAPNLHLQPCNKKDMLVRQVTVMLMDVPAEVRLG